MKKLFLIIFLGLFFWGHERQALAFDKVLPNFNLVPESELQKEEKIDEVLVKFKEDKINLDSTFSLSSKLRQLIFQWTNGYEVAETIKNGNIIVLKVEEGQDINEVIDTLKQDGNVEYAEVNYRRKETSLNIDDTYKTNLWGLDNTGQTLTLSSGATAIGSSDADIDMDLAWNLSVGETEIIVAVIDTGVAYNHPDLTDMMWDGTNCVDQNGDPLGNCLHGYDFGDGDKDPLPTTSSHGTHVAGTIAAERNNTTGVAGVGPKIKIMAIKCDLTVSCLIDSINFAIQNGAKVINASYGGPTYSSPEYTVINSFRNAGGIFVAAAGNDTSDNDTTAVYPANYDLDNIISVAATDQNDELASFSNYGATTVDIGAPGENIYSTIDESEVISYDFDNLDSGSMPSTWTVSGGTTWTTGNVGSGTTNIVIWTDKDTPYNEGVNSLVTASTLDLSMVNNAKFQFYAYCDTEYTDPSLGGDYMSLEVSSDGSSYTELSRWNEYSLAADGGVVNGGGYLNYFDDLSLDSQYFTSNFKYRLRWVTDSDGSYGTGYGCFIDQFEIITYTDGSDELYGFKNGTSMAAPHVAGLAGYLWSISPGASATTIITNIIDNGDTLADLASVTVSGRRINAYKSVLALGVTDFSGPTVTGLSNDSTPKKSKTFTWSSDNPSTDQYRFSIDQSVSGVPSGTYGTEVTTTYSSGSGTFYIHVQARSQTEVEGEVATASFVLDNNGPVVSLGDNSTNIFALDFGETIYSNVGETLGSDLASRFGGSSQIGISQVSYDGSETITVGVSGIPLAGSFVNLLSGTDNAFYDYLGNIGSTFRVYSTGSGWQLNPSTLNVGVTYLPDLLTTGILSLGGSSVETATSITVESDLSILIGQTGTNSSVGLTAGTIISELNDAEFDFGLVSGTEVEISGVSGLATGNTAVAAIQWGIVGTTLKFSQAIQIGIYVGSSYDGQSLNIFRSSALDSGWTTEALSSTTCTVSGGYCLFAATQASYYLAADDGVEVTPTPTPTPTTAPSNNNESNNQSIPSGPGVPTCNDRIPLFNPDLFKIVTSKGSAKIVFTPVHEQITSYAVSYGFKKGDERYAALFSPINNNEGEQSFTINKLNPKVTYYFKVTAYNGCVSGPWSEWIPAKADRKREIHKYKTVIKNKIKTLVNRFQ